MRHEFVLVLTERVRMSRVIHDTLLQGLVAVALKLQGLMDTTGIPSDARHELPRGRLDTGDHAGAGRDDSNETSEELRALDGDDGVPDFHVVADIAAERMQPPPDGRVESYYSGRVEFDLASRGKRLGNRCHTR